MTGTMTSNTPDSDRGELSYERRGSGRPLVLVHGWSLSWQTWLPVLDLLAAERDVIAVDLPGFGASSCLAEGDRYTVERLCEELEAFFARLGLDRPDVAGNSLGGLLSMQLACRGSVRTATGLCTPGFYGPVSVLRPLMLVPAGALARTPVLGPMLQGPRPAAVARKFAVARPELLADEIWLATVAASASAPGAMKFIAHNVWPIPVVRGRPAVPVTLAWGSHDRIIPSSTAVRAKRMLPDARQVLLPDCGHVPMSDDPQLVAQTLLDAAQ